ncbi:MAG: hypothetical protein GX589_01485, partial [Deltaproteobacteria bacterium]|nr:hypothetical protein [Deltaproteobacteria bacterium]
QAGLKKTKKKIGSLILEAVLYRRDLKVSLRAQAKMLGQAFVYLGYALPPLLILTIPCLVILAQLNLRYNARGLEPGERALLTLQLDKPVDLRGLTLQTSPGLSATPPVRDTEGNRVFWRIEPTSAGLQNVKVGFMDGSGVFTKEVYDSDFRGKLSAGRYKSWWESFFYPGDAPFPKDCAFSEFYIRYPEINQRLLGVSMHWLVIFLIVSILSGLVAAKLFKIEI